MKGKFFTFEGIDGSGKTTISKCIYEELRAEKKDIILTHEPTKSWIGDMAHRAVQEKLDPITILFFDKYCKTLSAVANNAEKTAKYLRLVIRKK